MAKANKFIIDVPDLEDVDGIAEEEFCFVGLDTAKPTLTVRGVVYDGKFDVAYGSSILINDDGSGGKATLYWL